MKKLISLIVALTVVFSFGIAFAKGGGSQNGWVPPPTAVANLVCTVQSPCPATGSCIPVSAYSSANVPSSVVVTVPTEECAQALADLLNAGLKIKNVQTVNPNTVLYTLSSTCDD